MDTSSSVRTQSLWRRTLTSWVQQVSDAFFLDLPFLVDSRWRHREYSASRNHDYSVKRVDGKLVGAIQSRPRYKHSAFVLLLLTLIFVAYGPTFAAICGTTSNNWLPRVLYGSLGTLFVVLIIKIINGFRQRLFVRCNQRLEQKNAGQLRRLTLRLLVLWFVVIAVILCSVLAVQNWQVAFDNKLCRPAEFHWRSLAQALLTLVAAVAAYILASARLSTPSFVRSQSLLLLAVFAINWWLLATPSALEAEGVPYRHTFAVFAAALFLIPLIAAPLAQRLFRSISPSTCSEFALALRHAELFSVRAEPEMSLRRLINALVNGPLYHPLHLFFLPALVAVMAADQWLWFLCLTAFFFAGLLLTWGHISTRWQQMVLYIDHWFFSGTPLVISLGVIGIATARLAGNQYVTTLLGAAPFGVIFMWILMTYALLWLFEQAISQALGPQLLRILNGCDSPDRAYTATDYINYPADQVTKPLADREHRYIALHGAGRLAVVGVSQECGRVFHTYNAIEIFNHLAAHSDVIEQRIPTLLGLHERLTDDAHDLERRVKLYFNVLNACVLATCGVLFWHLRSNDVRHTNEVVVSASLQTVSSNQSGKKTSPQLTEHFDLTAALQNQAREKRPALIVAASGGGTRAAVYTASALRGLAQIGMTDDIVLMSGVSGGGVALTYFAAHRPQLGSGSNFEPAPWRYFREQMAEPFIQDVLEGSMEWRITGAAPLSNLLVESFQRRLNYSERTTLGQITEVGLILNTSITGHPPSDSVLVGNAMGADATHTREHDCLPFILLSGGRMVFTNIADTTQFPVPMQSRLPDVSLPYVTVTDPQVELWRAAALNANFPPVFPNARVDLIGTSTACGGRRTYYVTDGGATENLGLLSALYALRSSLNTLQKQAAQQPAETIQLPELHIIALEASAIGYDYVQDRGIGTATGGSKERLAGGLTEQLIASIEMQLSLLTGKPTSITIHYLAMPTMFRSRGGVGTHWMLPNYVTITNPHLASPPSVAASLPFGDPNQESYVRLSKQQLFQLLDELHDPGLGFCMHSADRPARVSIATDWICGSDPKHPTVPDLHIREWEKLIATHSAAGDIALKE